MSRSPLGRIPWALAGALGLIVAVESAVLRHDLDLTTFEAADWWRTGRAAGHEAAGCQVLCFGDSLIKFGVAPRVIEARTGRRAYNLAVCLGQPPSSYFLLRRALASGARPSAVVIGYAPHQLAGGPWFKAERWSSLLDLGEGLRLALDQRDARFFASVMTGRYLPSLAARHRIRGELMAVLDGRSSSMREVVLPWWRNGNANAGGLVLPDNPQRPIIDTSNMPLEWACEQTNALYLRRFFALAAGRGIPVVWLLTPNGPEYQAQRDRLGLDRPFTRFVRRMTAPFPNVTVVDARRAGFEPGDFFDVVHLGRRGAAGLSAGLASVLGPDPATLAAGPRWVELPAVDGRAAEPLLEDYNQSRMALGAGSLRR